MKPIPPHLIDAVVEAIRTGQYEKHLSGLSEEDLVLALDYLTRLATYLEGKEKRKWLNELLS